mmetsp:Transcript_22169/g.57822  ORF Transcript_22169/g.57822 Transcript_22169/m.57822 type:complete len:266 (+) Transcript_22169:1246-2043(+)
MANTPSTSPTTVDKKKDKAAKRLAAQEGAAVGIGVDAAPHTTKDPAPHPSIDRMEELEKQVASLPKAMEVLTRTNEELQTSIRSHAATSKQHGQLLLKLEQHATVVDAKLADLGGIQNMFRTQGLHIANLLREHHSTIVTTLAEARAAAAAAPQPELAAKRTFTQVVAGDQEAVSESENEPEPSDLYVPVANKAKPQHKQVHQAKKPDQGKAGSSGPAVAHDARKKPRGTGGKPNKHVAFAGKVSAEDYADFQAFQAFKQRQQGN